jgi:large subunit ribosomal protein L22
MPQDKDEADRRKKKAERNKERREARQAEGVRAVAKYIRITPRKLRLVADLIRGKSAQEAWSILEFTPKRAAGPLKKVLESAIANAKHNNDMVAESLKVATVLIDEGPVMKRFTPRARGRASAIKKRTSHITVVVASKGEA